jgi:ribosome-associated toxin RatA of RatAB toxin-antitoxin module
VKSFDGRASSIVPAGPERCFALVATIDGYPSWNPDLVRRADVLERDSENRPMTVHISIHVAESPFGKDFDLRMAVTFEPLRSVSLTRIASGSSDRTELSLQWDLAPADGTRIDLAFHARTPLVPSFVPLPDVGGEIAQRLLDGATRALTRRPPSA